MNCFMKRERLFILCWLTYVTAYLCRVNFSSAMGKLSVSLDLSLTKLGSVGSCFFFAYAMGQIINGFLGDKLPPARFICFAITATGVMNLFMTTVRSYPVLLIIWSMNGYIQSMLWGPIMRILSEHFDPDARARLSTGMSLSMVAAFLLSWAVFARGFLPLSWRWYFSVPALAALAAGCCWIICQVRYVHASSDNRSASSDTPSALSDNRPASSEHTSAQQMPAQQTSSQHTFLRSALMTQRIGFAALACFCLGAIKESISLWAPSLMTRMLGLSSADSFLLICLIPLSNMAGILTSGTLIRTYHGNVRRTLTVLFGTAFSCALALFFGYQKNPILSVLLMAAVSGLMYGSNTILLSYLPISFAACHLVSTLVGIFDFLSYMGAALSSFCLGAIVSTGSFQRIFLFWLLLSGCAVILVRQIRVS